jgi:hypothetical protein
VLKSLTSTICGIGILIGAMLLILKRGAFGAGIVIIVLCGLLYLVTFASEAVKLFQGKYGKKVQGRDRQP